MAVTADNDALARELRGVQEWIEGLANDSVYVTGRASIDLADVVRRAADALEARLAADREALVRAIGDADWSVAPSSLPIAIADRLLASGAVVRVPTREAVERALNDVLRRDTTQLGDSMVTALANAVMVVKADGS